MGIEIYIGAEVEHESDRALLREIYCAASLDARPSLVLANLSLCGRQIDAVVIRHDLVLVLEAKAYARSVRGGVNGRWHVNLASGDWKECPNPWAQAVDGKHALKDAMRAFTGADTGFYPEASVIFAPEIPAGSSIDAGDFKASIIGLADMGARLQQEHGNCWDLTRWQAFAVHHCLIPVANLESAFSSVLLTAESQLDEYSQQFSRTYSTEANELVESSCSIQSVQCTSEDIIREACLGRSNIVLAGPSGCGKSLLAMRAGVLFLKSRGVPVFIRANEYQGNLKSLLDREVGLLSSSPAATLLKAARRLNRPMLLILDGYNECTIDKRAALTRGLAALSRWYEAGVLITSQIPLVRAELIVAREAAMPLPNQVLKSAIFSKATGNKACSAETGILLASVASGLEARLIGEARLELSTEISRYGLFDTFVRKRLGDAASHGIRALSLIAGWLSDHLTFSISVRDLDRFAQSEELASSLVSLLIAKNLLRSRGDRVSFSHELFLNAFVSEAVIRRSGGQPDAIIAALNMPRHVDRKVLIVGAIDDPELLTHVLQRLSDASVADACLAGSCGRFAREWVEAQYPALFGRMRDEIRAIHFNIDPKGWSNLAVDRDTLHVWTAPERALIDCLPDLLSQGVFLKELLELVAAMDQKIAEETARLREGASDAKIALRSPLFAMSYVLRHPDAPAINKVCSRLHGGLFKRASSAALTEHMTVAMTRAAVSAGQLNVLVALSRSIARGSITVASFLRWVSNTSGYNLRTIFASRLRMQQDVVGKYPIRSGRH